jgi:hypothetical protein
MYNRTPLRLAAFQRIVNISDGIIPVVDVVEGVADVDNRLA